MEEKSDKREEIRNYLKDTVNPVIEPLVKEIIKKRPTDLMKFIADYANLKISKSLFILDEAKSAIDSESDG